MSVTLTVMSDDGSTSQIVLADPVVNASAPIAFRSVASTTYAQRTNTTVNKPAGTSDNDILIAGLFVGATGTAPTPTAPAGWTQIGTASSVTDIPGFNGTFRVFWKRAAGEGASYTFTHASGSSQAFIAAYSGCVTSGSPVDTFSVNSGTGSTAAATGITTAGTNEMLLWVEHNWDIAAVTPPAGMTERFEGLIYLADVRQTAAGATGNKSTSADGNTISSSPWVARLIALKPANGSAQPQPQPPVVNAASFTVALPASNGQTVGTVTASESPTAWAITAGNASGYFAISSSGVITVTVAGASGMTAQTYNLTVQATNAAGSGSAAVSVVASTVAQSSIPMSKADVRFAGNTNGGGPFTSGTLANKNWDDSPGYSSGDACWVWSPTGPGTLNVSKCIIDWREGPRLSGWTSRSAIIAFDQCFINCVGKGIDHADGMQAWSNPPGLSTIRVTNSHFRAYSNDSAVAKYGSGFVESTCFFFADWAQADIIFDNCLFWADEWSVRIHADQGTTNVSFTNCFFTNPSGIEIIPTGGNLNVLAWTNNRSATVVNGAIVPGSLIPQP